MTTRIFAHWKTTLAGMGIAVLQIILNGRDPHTVAIAIFTAILGALAKD